ncbi:helix-turn-helix domain-containing protein [Aquidulcibacter sp.]|jgi:AraC-like DNA-binding protein|uniref:helix-turn-helix domain-containing protein n=1 Tax=Aquidulcibacter sp. TaxID=2052990 RepID=UPI0037C195C6
MGLRNPQSLAKPPSAIQIRQVSPHPSLRRIVVSFGERRADFKSINVIRALNARPDQFIEFYFREPYLVRENGAGFSATPASVLVGVTSVPGKDLGFVGEIETFTIRFQPTGLARLFGVQMTETVDEGLSLADELKRQTAQLEADLAQSVTFEQRVALAQAWIAGWLDHARPFDEIDHIARLVAKTGGRVSVRQLADRAGLSARQLQRRFLSDVGVTPKLYGRLTRFEAALAAQRKNPSQAWAQIAAEAGYADEAHLSREARALSGMTPQTFAAKMQAISTLAVVGPEMSDLFKCAI